MVPSCQFLENQPTFVCVRFVVRNGAFVWSPHTHAITPSARMGLKNCENATVDFDGLQNATRHRHICHRLHRVCLFNGTLVPQRPDGEDVLHAARVANSLIVRSQFGSHRKFAFSFLHPMKPPPPGSPAAQLLKDAAVSPCVPLVWVPVWAFSFADSFVSSLLPIDELQSAGLIDEHVLLRPELWAWPRSKNPVYKMIGELSSQSMRSVREEAPVCTERVARNILERAAATGRRPTRCLPHCYEQLVLCQFKSTFDSYEPPMAPWRAAQRVAASVLRRKPIDSASAVAMSPLPPTPAQVAEADRVATLTLPPRRRAPKASTRLLRVVFVNRTRTKFPRSLHNLWQLLQRCASGRERWAAGWRVVCSAHEFGAAGLASDVSAARAADVLVGTHGAGLSNAFFMRRGAALVEVRPYNFEGSWPDRYFRALSALERAVLFYRVSSGHASLSIPQPADNVSVWDARDHAVRLPWHTLREVLHKVIAVDGSAERYVSQLWAEGTRFVSVTRGGE